MELTVTEMITNVTHIISSGMSDWSGMHPLLVHFPIVLFLIAPLFYIASICLLPYRKSLQYVTLSLLILGVISAFLATSSGELAAEKLPYNPDIVETLSMHYELAEQARNIFCVLTGVFLLYLIFQNKFISKFGNLGYLIFSLLFLGAYFYAVLVLVNAAHHGGELVHHHSIHSPIFKEHK